ncbi:MAG: response regulator [Bacteroidetes bacterium]|nr:response regulator [Bacteroidota bacterium]
MDHTIRHICMADDDPDDYYLFETALKEVEPDVKLSWFDSCDKLLACLHTGEDLPDIIVLDMNMPGNTGHQCLLTIKREARLLHIPVFIYSTCGTQSTIKKAKECGASNYYVKPPSIQQIKEIIINIMLDARSQHK